MNDKRIFRFIKLYPWWRGITADLLFYTAIDTLFLSMVKGFTDAQIVSLTTISMIACIVLQYPLLWVVERIGNTISGYLSGICLLLSAVLITFAPQYPLVVAGRLFHDIAIVFQGIVSITLLNNLQLVDKEEEFTLLRTRGITIYSVLTMIIALVAGALFNFNPYLPMYGCVLAAAIGFVLSLYMKDYSDKDRLRKKKGKTGKLKLGGVVIFVLLVNGIFYTVVNAGQVNGKLFIQGRLLESFNADNTALIISVMVVVSRVLRVAANLVFAKVYRTCGSKISYMLTGMLLISIMMMLFGAFIPGIVIKYIVMCLGYAIILFSRDSFRLFAQDVLLHRTDPSYHKSILVTMEFIIKIGTAAMNFVFSLVLLQFTMYAVMWITLAVAVVMVVLSLRLYVLIRGGIAQQAVS